LPDNTTFEEDSVPAGTTGEEEGETAESPPSDGSTSSDGSNSSDDQAQSSQGSQENEGPQENVGQDAGTVVYDQNPEYQKVKLKCGAKSCIFNRQGNCHASEVEIDVDADKGQVPSATNCQTYQSANSG
jgi:hypothetical protein